MKALPSFGRNDVIRAIALVSVVAFPLIADAQLGPSRAIKISKDVSPIASAPPKVTIVGSDSCADEHWPFFSKRCLRGSTETTEPRMVSMNAESPPSSATSSDDSSKRAGATEIAQGNAPFAKPKKLTKPRVATHRRERRSISVDYTMNSEMGSAASW
jgi:hypothetical protein